MAWTLKSVNGMMHAQEVVNLGDTTEVFSTVIPFLQQDSIPNGQSVRIQFAASAVAGSNVDVVLYGALVAGGTKRSLVDPLVADITDATWVNAAVDIKTMPYPVYYIGLESDADETSTPNTITIDITM